MRLVALSLLCAVTVYGQGSQTPIYNGVLQSNLNAAGFKILSSNMADYAGTNMTWNAVTGKFDVTGGVGTVTSITATTPIVVTPSPLVSTGVISLADTAVTPGSYTNTNLTVDQKGRITTAANGTGGGVTSITGTAPISVTPTTGAAVVSLTAPLAATYMPAYTGDVTSSSGATVNTIGANKVTLGMMGTMATDSILGRATATTGNVEVLGALPFAFTGDVTRPVDSNAQTIANGVVTYAKMQNVSANSRLLGAGSAGTGLPPAEITVGSGLTMTGTTLTASAGGTGTVTNTGGNLTANSVVLGAGTVDTKVVPGVITDGTSKITLGVSTTSVGSIALNNLTSGSVTIQPATGALSTATMTIPAGATNPVVADTGTANNFLTGISTAGAITKARPAIANLSDAGTLATWAAVTPGTNVTTWLATPSSANLRGALTDENGTGAALFSGATTPDFTTGFTVGAAAASRKILVGNGTNYVPSTETWAVPGASTNNVLKSDGTNWTAAQLAFSNLSGSATAAQMPAYTGDVTSSAGTTANTIANNAVTYGKMQAVSAVDKLLGSSHTTTPVQEITLGTNLSMTGTTLNAAGGAGGSPAGANTNVQYNDSSAFGGDANFVWNKTTRGLSLIGNNATATMLIDSPAATFIPALRVRDSGATRYRADLTISNTGGLTFNSYDDTGTVYMPVIIDGSTINLRPNATVVASVSAAGSGGVFLDLAKVVGWGTAAGTIIGAPDTAFARNAAGVVEVNNGTAGTYRDILARTHNATSGYQVNGVATGADYINSSVSNQSPSTSDVYLTGSNVVVPAGAFAVKGQYHCVFDVTKSAGTGAIVITLRVGTAGTTADASIQTFTFGAGTSIADIATFEVFATWRTVGSGTSAVISGYCRGQHNNGSTGMFNNAQTWIALGSPSPSSGFASNTATNIGVSFNGATAFAGTITTVQASLVQ